MAHLSARLNLEDVLCWVKTVKFTPLWLLDYCRQYNIIDTIKVKGYWREIQCVVFLLYVSVLLTTTGKLIYTQNVLEMFFITDCLDEIGRAHV